MQASVLGVLGHESGWSVLAHVKRFALTSINELGEHATPGDTAWRDAVSKMSGWTRGELVQHTRAIMWSDPYRTLATRYAIEAHPQRIEGGGTVRIPKQEMFLQALARSISTSPYFLSGVFAKGTVADQNNIVADMIRMALADAFHSAPPPTAAAASAATCAAAAAAASTTTSAVAASATSVGAASATSTTTPTTTITPQQTTLLPDESVSMAPAFDPVPGEEDEAMTRELQEYGGSCFFSLTRSRHHGDEGTGPTKVHGNQPELGPPESMAEAIGH